MAVKEGNLVERLLRRLCSFVLLGWDGKDVIGASGAGSASCASERFFAVEERFVDADLALLCVSTCGMSPALWPFHTPCCPELSLARDLDGDLDLSSGNTVTKDEREFDDWRRECPLGAGD